VCALVANSKKHAHARAAIPIFHLLHLKGYFRV
jgi:hypothetical protein